MGCVLTAQVCIQTQAHGFLGILTTAQQTSEVIVGKTVNGFNLQPQAHQKALLVLQEFHAFLKQLTANSGTKLSSTLVLAFKQIKHQCCTYPQDCEAAGDGYITRHSVAKQHTFGQPRLCCRHHCLLMLVFSLDKKIKRAV